MATGHEDEVVETGYFGAGRFIPCEELSAGMVGYITASIKDVRETRVGDTVTHAKAPWFSGVRTSWLMQEKK